MKRMNRQDTSNPITQAKLECANYNNGKCLGVMIGSHLEQWVDSDYIGTCKIKKGKKCQYFDQIVAPSL